MPLTVQFINKIMGSRTRKTGPITQLKAAAKINRKTAGRSMKKELPDEDTLKLFIGDNILKI